MELGLREVGHGRDWPAAAVVVRGEGRSVLWRWRFLLRFAGVEVLHQLLVRFARRQRQRRMNLVTGSRTVLQRSGRRVAERVEHARLHRVRVPRDRLHRRVHAERSESQVEIGQLRCEQQSRIVQLCPFVGRFLRRRGRRAGRSQVTRDDGAEFRAGVERAAEARQGRCARRRQMRRLGLLLRVDEKTRAVVFRGRLQARPAALRFPARPVFVVGMLLHVKRPNKTAAR